MKHFKPLLIILLLAAVMLVFCACGIYNKEFISETDYVSPIQIRTDENGITVRNFNELKIAVLSIVEQFRETEESIIVFDTAYDGEPTNDITLACKQAITENALCAYCVEDITYDIYKVVTYYEATITVHFAETLKNDIFRLTYSGELKKYISDAIDNRLRQLVLLIDYTNYNEDDILVMISDYYDQNPLSAPKEPNATIGVYSGSGKQKLYEINFDYGLSAEELEERSLKISGFVFPDIPIDDETDELEKAVYACSYLLNNTVLSTARVDNTAYSALIDGKANSQGLSLAMIELCRRLNMDCRLVNGQKNWSNHYWNIIRINGDFYHIDIATCLEDGIQKGFLLNDERMWVTYRWDMAGYPRCSVAIDYPDSMFDPYLHERRSVPPENTEYGPEAEQHT